MASRRISDEEPERKRRPAAPTFEGRENQMVELAVDFAEKAMRDGTASSQIVAHYLKLGSSRELLEQERIRHENELTKVKIEAIQNEATKAELFENAIKAMRAYQGGEEPDADIF